MQSEWFVNLEGEGQIQLSNDKIIELIQQNKIKKGVLVWKKDFASWQPIELHFNLEAAKERVPVQQSLQSQNDLIVPQIITPNPVVPILTFLLSILSVVYFFWTRASSELSIDTSLLTFKWYGSLALSVFCISCFLFFTWKYSNFAWNDTTARQKGGFLKLLCFFGLAALGVYTALFGYLGLSLVQISKARSAFNKYTVDVDPASHSVSIAGLIGPDLTRRLIDKLTVHSNTQAIFVDSPGGLVDEGLSAAKFIESLASSTVVAQGTCNSSCLLLLMAGKNRLASWNMKLGFHATSAITELSEGWQNSISDLGEESYAYLERRGVPSSIIQKTKNKGADELELVSAIDLYDNGVLTGLIDGDVSINIENAKWKFLEEGLKDPEYSSLSAVLEAIRLSDQNYVRKYASPLYAVLKTGNVEQSKNLMAEMISSISLQAFQAAEGVKLDKYIGTQFLQIRYLLKLEQWEACAKYVNGKIGDAQSILSMELRNKELGALAALIYSAASNRWKPQPIPSWTENTIASIHSAVRPKALELELIDTNGKATSTKGECFYSYLLIEKILKLDADTAASVLRSILAPSASSSYQSSEAEKIADEKNIPEQTRPPEFYTYRDQIKRIIKKNWNWADTTTSLKASVSFSISHLGDLSEVSIVKSSGDSRFDNSVVRAVLKSSPLLAPPDNVYQFFKVVRTEFDPRE